MRTALKTRDLLFLCGTAILTACNHVAPHLSPYLGLVPAGYTVPVSSAPIDLGTLKEKTVAIVVSQNFETYTKTWTDFYERGGAQRAQVGVQQATSSLSSMSPMGAAMGSAIAANAATANGRLESDPRRVSDDVQAVLKSAFKSIVVATDFADAADKKADYIALFDFHLTGSAQGGALYTWGGVYMHDAVGRQLFKVENYTEAPRTFFDITSTKAYSIAMSRTITALHTGLTTKLGLQKER